MIKFNFFKKRESKEKELSREELISNIKNQIEELYEYSTDTLEQIINLENRLRELDDINAKLVLQSTVATQKNNTHLYDRARKKIVTNNDERLIIEERITSLKVKLKTAIEDIKSLENTLIDL